MARVAKTAVVTPTWTSTLTLTPRTTGPNALEIEGGAGRSYVAARTAFTSSSLDLYVSPATARCAYRMIPSRSTTNTDRR